MTVLYVIITLSILFWLLPPFRHYKTELFWYFLILAITDPITVLFQYLMILRTYNCYLFFSFLTLVALSRLSRNKRIGKVILVTVFILLIVSFLVASKFSYIVNILIHIMIFLLFVSRSIYFIAENGKVNLFHIIILLYESSLILKVLTLITDANTGLAFFYVTSFFQILIAIFFTIFREDDNKLIVDLRNI